MPYNTVYTYSAFDFHKRKVVHTCTCTVYSVYALSNGLATSGAVLWHYHQFYNVGTTPLPVSPRANSSFYLSNLKHPWGYAFIFVPAKLLEQDHKSHWSTWYQLLQTNLTEYMCKYTRANSWLLQTKRMRSNNLHVQCIRRPGNHALESKGHSNITKDDKWVVTAASPQMTSPFNVSKLYNKTIHCSTGRTATMHLLGPLCCSCFNVKSSSNFPYVF